VSELAAEERRGVGEDREAKRMRKRRRPAGREEGEGRRPRGRRGGDADREEGRAAGREEEEEIRRPRRRGVCGGEEVEEPRRRPRRRGSGGGCDRGEGEDGCRGGAPRLAGGWREACRGGR